MLEKTWRWFGENDSISLSEIKQTGAEGIVTALHHIPNGEVWPVSEILKVKEEIEAYGLHWSVVESLPVPEGIKTADADRDELIKYYKLSLDNLGRCGIERVCYNFMPVLDWARTHINHPAEAGGECMFFDYPTFAAFDIFILKRPDASNDYSKEIYQQANDIIEKLTPEQKEKLAYNIIVLTQGFIDGAVGDSTNYKVEFLSLIDKYKNIDDKKLRENLRFFLSSIMPVADKYGIKMCIHPDDPPFPVLGLPRIVSTQQDLKQIIEMYPSINNGITLCAGSLSAIPDNNIDEILASLGSWVHFAHLRSTQHLENHSFYEAGHIGGSVNMYSLIKKLMQEQAQRKAQGRSDIKIPFRPDHGTKILDDFKREAHPGYQLIGRLKGLSEIFGLMTAIDCELKNG